jgi:hypothetical protein
VSYPAGSWIIHVPDEAAGKSLQAAADELALDFVAVETRTKTPFNDFEMLVVYEPLGEIPYVKDVYWERLSNILDCVFS